MGIKENARSQRNRNDGTTGSLSYQSLEPRQLMAAVINEFSASSTSNVIVDDNGNSTDWIEIFNTGQAPINLAGYSLTDDPSDPSQFVFPNLSIAGGEYLVVFAGDDANPTTGSDLYTGFGLSAAGDYIGLYDPAGNVVSEFGEGGADYPALLTDVSYGLAADGNFDTASFFATPTPGFANVNPVQGITSEVTSSVTPGFYEGTISVELATDTQSAFIIFTDDGSTPTLANATLYTGPIQISSTTNLRAVSVRPNFLSGFDRTWSYLFIDDILNQSPATTEAAGFPDEDNRPNGGDLDYGIDPQVIGIEGRQAVEDALLSIASISITTDIENLFDPNDGIYVNPLEAGREYERPASVELINPDGSEGFQVNAGIRIRGGFSRLPDNPKHSFRLFFRSEYGDSELNYPLHGEDSPVDTFQNLDLRTAQNYSWSGEGPGSNISNTFINEVISRQNQGLSELTTQSTWAHLYLNGQYWGLYQTQERAEADFAASYLGGDPDNFDVVAPDAGPASGNDRFIQATDGNTDAYFRLFDQANALAPDNSTPAFVDNVAYLAAQGLDANGNRDTSLEVLLDVDNLITYVTEIWYSGNFDSGISRFGGNTGLNNFQAIRDRTGDEGFKFFVHDAEHSLRDDGRDNVNIDRTIPLNDDEFDNARSFNPITLHQRLMANAEYRLRFADSIQENFFNDGIYTTENIIERWEAEADKIRSAIIAESARWGDAQTAFPRLQSDWENALNNTRDDFLARRNDIFLNQLRDTIIGLRAPNGDFQNGGGQQPQLLPQDAPLFPSVTAPVFVINGAPQHGGAVSAGEELQFNSTSEGTIFFTTDGSDPREFGGAVSSSAQVFDGTVSTSTLFTAGSSWQFEDNGLDLGEAWREPGFNDSAWSTGNGRFGFGEPGSTTTVNSGPTGDRNVTTYFRREFTSTGDYDFATLSINRDDGVVVYLNGVEVVRDNLPAGDIDYDTFASSAIGGNAETAFVDFVIPASLLVNGVNTIAVEVHQVNATSSDLGFDAELTVGQFSAGTAVPLNITTAIQSRTLSSDGTWSPLQSAVFSVAGGNADVSDLRITEINYNPADPASLVEQNATADNDDFEFLELYNSNQTGSLNLSGLQFDDGIALTFSNDVLAPGERAVVVRNTTAFEARYGTQIRVLGEYGGSLSNGGEEVRLVDSEGAEVLSVEYDDSDPWSELADGGGTSLVLVDPDNTPANELSKYYSWRSSVERGGSPGAVEQAPLGVVINEVVANPSSANVDAVELFNSSAVAVNIGGWYLGDDADDPLQFQIPFGTILEPGQYVVFEETDFNPTPATPQANHFGLSGSGGDEVFLTRIQVPTGLIFEDGVSFGASFNGESFGRDPNGSGRLTRLDASSLGSVNGNTIVGPLVISEVNYHPGDPSSAALAIDSTLTDSDLEFIEIHNPTSSAVDTTDWRIRGEVDFDFPAGSLAAGGAWVLVSFDPALNSSRLNAFRTHYGIGTDVTVLGPFSDDGSLLSNSSGRISLQQPDDPVAGDIPHVVVDEVVYDDLAPWADADGSGSSLNRIDGNVSGNFASNWSGQAPTPGVANLVATAPQVANVIRDGGSIARPDLWSTFAIQFSADVNVNANALTIRNDSLGGTLVDLTGITLSYDSGTSTATWDLSGLNTPLDAAFYTVTLNDNLVTGSGGMALDGNANGNAGGSFTTQVYQAIPGDANLDGTVSVLGDAFTLVGNLGIVGNTVWAQGDFNADGQISVLRDAFPLVGNLGRSVVPPAAASRQFIAPADFDSQSFLLAESTPTQVLTQTTLQQSDSSTKQEKQQAPLAESATPVLSGSQRLDDAFASDDWFV